MASTSTSNPATGASQSSSCALPMAKKPLKSSTSSTPSCPTSSKPSKVKYTPKGKVTPELLKPKRSTVSLVHVISYGTPQKVFPREGTCHRVSPLPKRYDKLTKSQLGIKKVVCAEVTKNELDLLKDATNLQIVDAMIDRAVKQALAEERARHIFLDDIDRGVILRSLVKEWQATSCGKEVLQDMCKAVNEKYAALGMQRRVQDADVIRELKCLIRGSKDDKDDEDGPLQKAVSAISSCCEGLRGEKFLELMESYLTTNQQVHPAWTEEKLQRLIDMVKNGDIEVGGEWLQRMAADIAKSHRWNLSW